MTTKTLNMNPELTWERRQTAVWAKLVLRRLQTRNRSISTATSKWP